MSETIGEKMVNDTRQAPVCRICRSPGKPPFLAREMMFGMRDTFAYFECSGCGCVQIAEYPAGIEKYYPETYYSFGSSPAAPSLAVRAKAWLRTSALRLDFIRNWHLRRASTVAWLARKPVEALYLQQVSSSNARILDVGCGDGALLRNLRSLGFRRSEGVDPFVAADIHDGGNLLVRRAFLQDMTGSYDCISLHHALEHMPNQADVLRKAAELLAPDGILMIRIPVAGGEAWRTYGADWVQLDPPRHYYVHTEKSLGVLAQSAGLRIASITYDSTGFQYWGSELYRQDIPLTDARSPQKGSNAIFSQADIAAMDTRSAQANARRDGDQIVAILTRP